MKRILGLFVLVGMLAVPAMALAAEQIGVYVTPKFVYGITLLEGVKTDWLDDDNASFMHIGDATKGTVGGGISVGYDFNRRYSIPIRSEIEYALFSQVKATKNTYGNFEGYNTYWSTKQTFQIQTLFINAYYDFRNSTDFTPYLGAGIGMSFINVKANNYGIQENYPNPQDADHHSSPGSKTTTNFAWNVGAGISYDFNDYVALDLGYRFAGLGSARTKTALDSDGDPWVRGKTNNIYMHQILSGLRLTF
jgi:opacity protein-like surface antigen